MIEVPPSSAAALAYEAVSNRFWLADQLAAPLLAVLLLVTGLGSRLCAGIARRTLERRYLVVALYALAFVLVLQMVRAPLDYFWEQAHARASGSPAPSTTDWLAAQLGSTLELGVAFVAVACAMYWLLRRAPRFWWLVAAIVGSCVVLAGLVAQPWTRAYTPLGNSPLDSSIAAMAAKAGVPASRIGVEHMDDGTGCGAATVIGLGPTRVILLDQALVEHYPEGEVLGTVAHESSHFVHDDNVKAFILVSSWLSCALLVAHFAGGWAVSRWHDRFGFDSLADPASLPLVVLLLCVTYVAGLPAARRYQQQEVEQRADRFALELTHDNASEAMLYVHDMKCYPLMVSTPSRFFQTFRATHPTIEQRILFARSYHPWRSLSNP